MIFAHISAFLLIDRVINVYAFTYVIRSLSDNIYVSNEAYTNLITMLNTNITTEIQTTIDELNQYLNGNVTKTSLQITLDELISKL